MSFIDYYSKKELGRLAGETNILTKQEIHGFDVYCASEPTALAKVRVIFKHGSFADDIKGIHHALEHMLFKGKNAKIVETLEFLGANLNAFTSVTETRFVLECSVFKLIDVIPVFAEMFNGFKISEEDWISERTVIHSERIQSETEHNSVAWSQVDMAMYADDVQSNIVGTEESLNSITVEDLASTFKAMTYRQNMIITMSCSNAILNTAITNLTFELSKIIEYRPDRAIVPEAVRYPLALRGAEVYEQTKTLEHIKYIDFTKCYDLDLDVSNPVHDMLASILSIYIGGGLSSPLFDRIRNKLGSVYDCTAFIDRNLLGLTLCFSIGIHAEDITPYENEVKAILDEMAVDGMTEEGFTRAKNAVEFWIAKSAETGIINSVGYYANSRSEKIYEAPHMMLLLADLNYENANVMIKEILHSRIKSTTTVTLYPYNTIDKEAN